MKRIAAIILVYCMLFALAACGKNNSTADGSAYPEDLITEDFKYPLGDTGAKVAIPAELGFEAYESELNDFYGGGPGGDWRIIVNTELKSDLADCTLADYASLTAQANEGEVGQDANGNYFFTYVNKISDEETYKFYTAVREGSEKYYRVSFYCFDEYWETFGDRFAEWAMTIEVE